MLFPILKDSYQFFWKNKNYFIAIMLPLVIPLEIFKAIYQANWVTDPVSLVQQVPVFMATLVIYPIYQGALVLCVYQLLSGQEPRVQQLWARGASFWFVIVLVNVLFYIAFFAGLMLFILPGIYIGVRLTLAEQNAVLNNESAFEALKSSWEDTSDQFGILLFGSILIAFSIVVPFMILTPLIHDATNGSVLILGLLAILQSLFYPLFVVFYMRVRHYIRNSE